MRSLGTRVQVPPPTPIMLDSFEFQGFGRGSQGGCLSCFSGLTYATIRQRCTENLGQLIHTSGRSAALGTPNSRFPTTILPAAMLRDSLIGWNPIISAIELEDNAGWPSNLLLDSSLTIPATLKQSSKWRPKPQQPNPPGGA